MSKRTLNDLIISFIFGVIFPILICITGIFFSVPYYDVSDKLELVHQTPITAEYELHVDKHESGELYDLMLKTLGCRVTVNDGDKILFRYGYGHGYGKDNRIIGLSYLSIPLTCDNKESDIRILLEQSDYLWSPEIAKAHLCLNSDSHRYYLTNGSLAMPLALLMLGASVCGALVYVAYRIKYGEALYGLYAFGTMLCFAVILLAQEGHYLVFISNQFLYNYVHYVAEYLLPVCAFMFIRGMMESKRARNVMLAVSILGMVLLAATLATDALSNKINVSDLGWIYVYYVALICVIGVYILVRLFIEKRESKKHFVILIGILVWAGLIFIASRILKMMFHGDIAVFNMYTTAAFAFSYIICYVLVQHIDRTHTERIERENAIRELENDLMRSKIRNLNTQIQPHFVFNVINSIQEIVYENPDYASELLGDFAIHLRGVVRMMDDSSRVLFSDELRSIKAYADIEKMRMGERLKLVYEVEADDFYVSPLSIQPLVENAIRHGVRNNVNADGTVIIHSYENKNEWIVEVTDFGSGFDVEETMDEIRKRRLDSSGLMNTVYRLEKEMDAVVEINSEIGYGTRVTVRLPKGDDGYEDDSC